ncbi:hypothetical protein SANTM175S_08313 [Streptomyces antimycoticus]
MTVVTCLRKRAWEDQSFSSSISSLMVQRLRVMRLGTPVSTVPTITVRRSSHSGHAGAGTPPPSATVNASCRASEVLPALSVARNATVWRPTRSTATGVV